VRWRCPWVGEKRENDLVQARQDSNDVRLSEFTRYRESAGVSEMATHLDSGRKRNSPPWLLSRHYGRPAFFCLTETAVGRNLVCRSSDGLPETIPIRSDAKIFGIYSQKLVQLPGFAYYSVPRILPLVQSSLQTQFDLTS
jgi:hypothetical protein